MAIRQIETEADNKAALEQIEALILSGPEPGSAEDEELEALVALVMAFEDEHYPIEQPAPAAAKQFRQEQEVK